VIPCGPVLGHSLELCILKVPVTLVRKLKRPMGLYGTKLIVAEGAL